MNFVAAICLFGAQSEFEAFVTLEFIINKINWSYMFSKDMVKVQRLMEAFLQKLKEEVFDVYSLLKKMEVEPVGFFSQYFIGIMSYNLEIENAIEFMDLFLLHEHKVINRLLINSINLQKETILGFQDDFEAITFMS